MTDFLLPELGEDIEYGDVASVFVSVGDTLKMDDPVLELETDKAIIEVPSTVSGKVTEILVEAGDTVSSGQKILIVAGGRDGRAEEDADEMEARTTEKETEEEKAEVQVSSEAQEQEQASEDAGSGKIETFHLPDMGEDIEVGDVVTVFVSAGDSIGIDAPVIEVETDKAIIEVPSTVKGTVVEVLVKSGDQVKSGDKLLTVESTGPSKKAPPKKAELTEKASESEPEKTAAKAPAQPETAAQPVAPDSDEVNISGVRPHPGQEILYELAPAAPSVRRFAREIGIDIRQVPGTGPGGRISEADVKVFAKELTQETTQAPQRAAGAAPVGPAQRSLPDFSKFGEVDVQGMSGVRRSTATHLSYAWQTIPHVTQFDQADWTETEELRKQFSKQVEAAGGKLTPTAIILKVLAAAVKKFPDFATSVDMENQQIVYKKYCHIGVAVDTPRGLLVPVIRDVDKKNITELAIELGEMAQRARDGKTSLQEMQGSVIALTNLGGIGGSNFAPIINWPDVAIVGVSRSRTEPVYIDGEFRPRLIMPLSLSYDHRVIDGVSGARFLRWIAQALENPFTTLLLEG